ncbi:MAG: hypothetical protein FJZ04_02220 [Candidatus Moranbacteria bacterium]|nr:hypothetical protein [Candidatus Moranbacteria bacterium]
MKIYTHLNVDLDACASVWAAKDFVSGARDATVELRPANWNGAEMEEGDLALDIEAGGKGLKGEKGVSGIVYSCFATVVAKYASPEDQAALAELTIFVNLQDATGNAYNHLLDYRWIPDGIIYKYRQVRNELKEEVGSQANFAAGILSATGLNAVLRAFQATHPRNDALVVERMGEIFSGLLANGRARYRAEVEANQAKILPGGRVAIVTDSKEFGTNGVLFERGVRAVVYQDGPNIGLIRRGDETLRMDHPLIREIVIAAGELDEWFAHPAGFLFCRGSRKAPAEQQSRVDPRAIAAAADRALVSS